MTTTFAWVITQRVLVIPHRRFGDKLSEVVSKRRQDITTTRCVITQKNTVIIYFAFGSLK